MENGMQGATNIQGIFDLKGSMVNRIVHGKSFKPTATLKDRNLLQMNQEKLWIRFSDKHRRQILKMMRTDVKLLQTYNLMDYSLLMCIQENPDYVSVLKEFRGSSRLDITMDSTEARKLSVGTNSPEMTVIRQRFEGNRHKFLSKCGRFIYHIGIIDYLQDYNLDKKLENLMKYTILRKGPGISAVPPPIYGDRFLRFMRDSVIIDQRTNQGNNRKFLKVGKSNQDFSFKPKN